MKLLYLFLVIFVSGCVQMKQNKLSEISINNQHILNGSWGWNVEQCGANPIDISFSKDGKIMFHRTKDGMYLGDRNNAIKEAKYFIQSESVNLLVTSIESEDRKDASGNPVVWELVIQTPNKFCWHRTDWQPGSCTKSLSRCQ